MRNDFEAALELAGHRPLRPLPIEVLQINVGKKCNQRCRHCHVEASPDRIESMTRATMQQCLDVLDRAPIPTVDITGGAPEINPDFRWLVEQCRARDRRVMDRCNLTILQTKPHWDLPEFFAANRVEVICSLPHYRALGTDRQRGDGVYEKSIAALKRLNGLGYGDGRSGLKVHLVTNPVGAFLPGDQGALTREWKRELQRLHGIVFDELYCLTNMPIGRFLQWLKESGNLEEYQQTLVNAFNPRAVPGLMCRTTLSVGWDGRLYDCDFNQMLELGVDEAGPRHIADFDAAALGRRSIRVGPHCFGCTAGAGSSCGGATAT